MKGKKSSGPTSVGGATSPLPSAVPTETIAHQPSDDVPPAPRFYPYARPKARPGPYSEPVSGVMKLAIPTSLGTSAGPYYTALAEAAKKRMMEIAERAQQQTTRQQNFAKRVEAEKKKRRGGAPGDVAP